jgi:prepilin-type N-terminal cleavage/methylation domain-containing protein
VVKRSTPTSYSQQGFTLIELSIVLVIIGLIVGGVLVGRDMIHAAAVRAQVAQIEKYNAAVNTFRAKYNALPGDMIPTVAASYGIFTMLNPLGLAGLGDNNGLIEDGLGSPFVFCGSGNINANHFCGELPIFWRHLTDSNLVDGQLGVTSISLPTVDSGITGGTVINVAQSIPPAKIGRGMFVTVMSGRGANYFDLLPVVTINAAGAYTIGTAGMTPIEAQNIDAKIDDGQPETGRALALGLAAPSNSVAGSPASLIGGVIPSNANISTLNKCVIGNGATTTDTYNLVPSTGGNDASCALAIRFQ